MARTGIRFDASDLTKVMGETRKLHRDMARGVKRTVDDLAKKKLKGTLGIVRAEVSKVYNVPESRVSKEIDGKTLWWTETGSITLEGVKIPSYTLEARGRMMTPRSFGMKPTRRLKRPKPVTWKPFVAGGQKPVDSTTGYPVFLASMNGSPYIPASRKQEKTWTGRPGHWKHLPVKVEKRLSVPIMMDNEKVQPHIQEEILRRIATGMFRYVK